MLDRLRKTGWKQVVAALYALAMLMLGFAHMPMAASAGAAGAEIAALALPDGTASVICGQSRPDAPSHHGPAHHCDACQLTSAPGALPSPPALLDAPRLAMKLPPVRVIASVAAAQTLDPQSRGPPCFPENSSNPTLFALGLSLGAKQGANKRVAAPKAPAASALPS